METVLVHVMIGNSDDRLSQYQWSRYIDAVDAEVGMASTTIQGTWFSAPAARWQNAAWTFVMAEQDVMELQRRLSYVAGNFEQDSIAWMQSSGATLLQGRL